MNMRMKIMRYLEKSLKSKIKPGSINYAATSEAEGKAIVAASLAAVEIFSPAIYQSHGSGKLYLLSGERMKPFKGGSIPKDATFFQLMWFNFDGPLKNFILVQMGGVYSPDKQKINWKVESVCAPERSDILSKEELTRLS